MILFYREPNGDYLCVVRTQWWIERGQVIFDGRATAIAELVSSVCTTGIGERFLKTCKRVARCNVPAECSNTSENTRQPNQLSQLKQKARTR